MHGDFFKALYSSGLNTKPSSLTNRVPTVLKRKEKRERQAFPLPTGEGAKARLRRSIVNRPPNPVFHEEEEQRLEYERTLARARARTKVRDRDRDRDMDDRATAMAVVRGRSSLEGLEEVDERSVIEQLRKMGGWSNKLIFFFNVATLFFTCAQQKPRPRRVWSSEVGWTGPAASPAPPAPPARPDPAAASSLRATGTPEAAETAAETAACCCPG